MAEINQKTNTPTPGGDKKRTNRFEGNRSGGRGGRSGGRGGRDDRRDEFEQRILEIARVTRVMAGGKRMNFRACVAIGDRKSNVGVGLGKGADVTIAVNKAVNQAKKQMIRVPLVKDSIPHEVRHKFGAAIILLKPASQGKGVIAGGVIRAILELAGIKNVTSKIIGTNNKINNARCTILALSRLKSRGRESVGDKVDKDLKNSDNKKE